MNSNSDPQELPKHKWGIFGTYEYLGAGTPYVEKIEAGIQPVNELDRVAMFHDSQYHYSQDHFPFIKNIERAVFDIGAGAVMLTTGELGLVAGSGLITQAMFRLTPFGFGLDLLFY